MRQRFDFAFAGTPWIGAIPHITFETVNGPIILQDVQATNVDLATVNGRIVYVFERRLESKERVRWFVDAESLELHEVSFDGGSSGSVIWRPALPRSSFFS